MLLCVCVCGYYLLYSTVKGSVTVRYIFVYCRFMSLFAKNLLG